MADRTASLRNRRSDSTLLVTGSFLLPAGVLLVLFVVVPFLAAVAFSFTDLRLISPLPVQFVGLRNYVRTLTDPIFLKALLNNAKFVLAVVPVQTTLALWLAILVNQKHRGIKLFRTIYFAPVVTVMTVAATIWRLLYQPDGLVNGFLGLFSGSGVQIDWLHSTVAAMPAVILMSIWQGVGFQMVILLAGLQEIPEEIYEAADIDGAGRWGKFRHVTLPQLRNTLVFVVTVTTILAFRLFDQVWILTNGGPLDSTQTMMMEVVRVGFRLQRIGQGSAIAVIFFLIVLLISQLQRLLVREEGEIQ